MQLFRSLVVGVTFAFIAGKLGAQPETSRTGPPPASHEDDYYKQLFLWDPNLATTAGIHTFDDKLADLSASRIAARISEIKASHERFTETRQLLRKLEEHKAGSFIEQCDNEILILAVTAELLELETIKTWK